MANILPELYILPPTSYVSRLSLSIIQSQEHRELSLQAAMKSFVLLKNDDNALPMDEVDKVCVCVLTCLFQPVHFCCNLDGRAIC